MNRIYTFNNVLTEYTEIGKLDDRGGKKTAITNVMLHPENDSKTLKELFTIYKAYTGMTSEKEISDKFFKKVNNTDNAFHGYYKLKLRRVFFYNKGLGTTSPANIKGEFPEDVISKSVKKCSITGKLIKCKPNYTLFVHDCTGEKPVCYTDKLNQYSDGFVNRADVQVVVEKGYSKNGIQLTLFKYRKLEAVDMDSSNKSDKVEDVKYNDGLDALFNNFDENDDGGDLYFELVEPKQQGPNLELDDEINF